MNKNHGIAEKKIIRLLTKLPPEFLLTLDLTINQIEYWFELNQSYSAMSLCWQATHRGENDPLLPLLKSGEIDSASYDFIWMTHDYYERLWELVQISFVYVQPEIMRILGYDPKTAYTLFEQILYESSVGRFRGCLEPYVEISAPKLVKSYKVVTKVCEKKELRRAEEVVIRQLLKPSALQQSLTRYPALAVTLSTCFKKVGKRKGILRSRLEGYTKAVTNLTQKSAKLYAHMPSHAWKGGRRGEGYKDGTYKFS